MSLCLRGFLELYKELIHSVNICRTQDILLCRWQLILVVGLNLKI
jgi:hypothetical protein